MTSQPDLLDWKPPAPQSILGDRDGYTFHRPRDGKRLNKQAQEVWDFMADGKWRSLRDIAEATGHPEASISARLRDFRKGAYGGNDSVVECVYIRRGLHRYKLHAERMGK